MARFSAEARAVHEGVESGRLIPGERLPPPADISPEEREEWERITEPLPPGFITSEHRTMMRELVRVTVFTRRLGEMIDRLLADCRDLAADDERLCRLQAMMKTYDSQIDKLVLLSRSLRITKTAREDRGKASRMAKRVNAKARPWHDWGRGREKPLES
jgi:hypothetical protein